MKDLRIRTKEFALRVIRLYSSLTTSIEAQVLGKQLLRSGTSVGAHYREAIRARSNAELAEAYLYHDPMTKKQNNPEYTRSQQSYRH